MKILVLVISEPLATVFLSPLEATNNYSTSLTSITIKVFERNIRDAIMRISISNTYCMIPSTLSKWSVMSYTFKCDKNDHGHVDYTCSWNSSIIGSFTSNWLPLGYFSKLKVAFRVAQQTVSFRYAFSEEATVPSSASQCSVIMGLLLLVMVNDLQQLYEMFAKSEVIGLI